MTISSTHWIASSILVITAITISVVVVASHASADVGYPDDLWPAFTARYREVTAVGEHVGATGSAVYDLDFDSRSSWTRTNVQHSHPDRQGSQQSFQGSKFTITRWGFPPIQTSYPDGEYASPGYWLVLWDTAFDGPPEADGATTKYSQVFPCARDASVDCRLTRTVTLDTESKIPLRVEEHQNGELVYLFEMIDLDISAD